ncbi:uncharacterized protein LOC112341178 isoform X2 [Selaginella moellendorffii]|uniref:uncharacterized protein LOC112341178 isoform X2 n=1 Tax=Selaginella moellendorffii TaxID=88036 RepID=UPI000D1C35DE|nr:uncharacterized protein LOC112341178 isoform X2 [Selaginella moellendorffii]|eukprot:XP_024516645.1 uncharacterized protein LOC112341178 isoform X2 [Selaginella moellendorffii]
MVDMVNSGPSKLISWRTCTLSLFNLVQISACFGDTDRTIKIRQLSQGCTGSRTASCTATISTGLWTLGTSRKTVTREKSMGRRIKLHGGRSKWIPGRHHRALSRRCHHTSRNSSSSPLREDPQQILTIECLIRRSDASISMALCSSSALGYDPREKRENGGRALGSS